MPHELAQALRRTPILQDLLHLCADDGSYSGDLKIGPVFHFTRPEQNLAPMMEKNLASYLRHLNERIGDRPRPEVIQSLEQRLLHLRVRVEASRTWPMRGAFLSSKSFIRIGAIASSW